MVTKTDAPNAPNTATESNSEEISEEVTSAAENTDEVTDNASDEDAYLDALLELDEDDYDISETTEDDETDDSEVSEETQEDTTDEDTDGDTTPKPDSSKVETKEDEASSQSQQDPKPDEKEKSSETPEDLNAAYKTFFDGAVEQLAEKVYRFDEETVKALDTKPSTVLPRLAAQLHMQVLGAAVTQAAQMMPALIQQTLGQTDQVKANENAFFTAWPALKEHRSEVERIAKAYREVNPNADMDTMIQEIGTMASVRLKLPLPNRQTQEKPAVTKPPIPTTARGGSTPPAAQPKSGENSWLEDLLTQEE